MTSATIAALYRYPVKGFSAQSLGRIPIEAGSTLPFDRAFAIENGASGFDPSSPRHLPKVRFLMLMRNEEIARYRTDFDERDGTFTVKEDGRVCLAASLFTEDGRRAIEAWSATAFASALRGPPRVLSADGHSFSDEKRKVLHLINLASVRALESELGRAVDPLRFRPNILIDGAPPFAEREWVGSRLRAGGGVLAALEGTVRCAATNVDPASGARDMDILRALLGRYGHQEFGIYLEVERGGEIGPGDALGPLNEAAAPP